MKHVYLSAFLLLLGACSGGGGGSSSSSTPTPTNTNSSVILVDPYIEGGTIFWDEDEDGLYDEGEAISEPSNENGVAQFSIKLPKGAKLIQQGKGVSGGKPFGGKLKTSYDEDNNFATPITTLLENGFSEDEILDLINEASSAFGVTFDSIEDLLKNPMASVDSGTSDEDDLALLKASMAITSILNASNEGFELTPDDIDDLDNFKSDFFEKALIFNEVINIEDIGDPEKMVKIAVAIQEFVISYGVDDFKDGIGIDPVAIQEAMGFLRDEFELNEDEDIKELKLAHNGLSFSASVEKETLIPDGNHHFITFYIQNYDRDYSEDSNYWGGNLQIQMEFGVQSYDSGVMVEDDGSSKFELDETTGLMSINIASDEDSTDSTYLTWNYDNLNIAEGNKFGSGVFQFSEPEDNVFRAIGIYDLYIDWVAAKPESDESEDFIYDEDEDNFCIDVLSFTPTEEDPIPNLGLMSPEELDIVSCGSLETKYGDLLGMHLGYIEMQDEEVKIVEHNNFINPEIIGTNPQNFKFRVKGTTDIYQVSLSGEADDFLITGTNEYGYDILSSQTGGKELPMQFTMSHGFDDSNFPETYPINTYSGISITKNTDESPLSVTLNSAELSFAKDGVMFISLEGSGLEIAKPDGVGNVAISYLLLDFKTKKGYASSALSDNSDKNYFFNLDLFEIPVPE